MDITNAFKRQHALPGLIGIEKISMIYCGFTLILALLYMGIINNPVTPIINRIFIITGTLCLWRLYKWYPCNFTHVIRTFFQLGLLAYWYPDIYNFSRFMPNLDHVFALCDQQLFGCQPAIMLSRWLPGLFWEELFNMGYFSYYIMIIIVVIATTFYHYKRFDKTTTIILCSFLFYFTIFLFLESAGPQFYFHKIGIEEAMKGNFPGVNDWFRYHPELIHSNTTGGIFTTLVHWAQGSEKPIAAFPSSHVGIATILLILTYKMSKKLFKSMLPLYIILCISTVYIGAHYAIDIIAGWITAFVIYSLSEKIYYTRFIHRPKHFENL